MTSNLWSANKANLFWQCHHLFDDELWKYAVQKAVPILELQNIPLDENHLLELVLGFDFSGQAFVLGVGVLEVLLERL